ncbi:MAG: aminoacetone oxidase family FAD-binding enzyme [Mogibacterium sp.]|nr:aminoacetone oxidase family FAD-binding enzyme [Mogibacterium sp.]
MYYDCIIIGGGASGLMLAATLDMKGRKGLLLEKTTRLGTKLLMSGGGRCNITHGGSIKEFVNVYGEAGPRLRKCLYRHSNTDLTSWLEAKGIPLTNEHDRIFPASMKASDILGVFLDCARSNGWEIRTEAEVYDFKRNDDGSLTVMASPADSLRTRRAVIATGGITYPETGSDGSMHDILRAAGTAITPLRSALAPVYVEDYPYEELSGVSIENVTVTAFSSDAAATCKGKAARMTGDLLFTHRGFSGPVILNISRYAEAGQLIRISYNKSLDDLPKRLRKCLEERSKGPSGDIRTTRLAALLDSDDFTVSGIDEHGMVTAGGISLDDIDTASMKIRSLSDPDGSYAVYAIGEAIDADGITGGYNLQMCWSTANAAADNIRVSLI